MPENNDSITVDDILQAKRVLEENGVGQPLVFVAPSNEYARWYAEDVHGEEWAPDKQGRQTVRGVLVMVDQEVFH